MTIEKIPDEYEAYDITVDIKSGIVALCLCGFAKRIHLAFLLAFSSHAFMNQLSEMGIMRILEQESK